MTTLSPTLNSILALLRQQFSRLRSFVLSRTFAYILASLAATFLLFNYLIMPWYVSHGGTLGVPDVTNVKLDEAMRRLDEAGLVGIAGDSVLDNSHEIGAVVLQNPGAGSVVKHGRRVYLTICGGEVLVPVPNLRGRSLRDARFALERNGLALGDVVQAPSDSSPVNTIISQTIASTDRVKKGTAVGVAVSIGSLTKTIEVPNVRGKSLTEAEKILEYFGLALGKVTYQFNPEVLPNTVVEQIPQAGVQVDSGRVVDVFVVKAGFTQDER